MATQTRRASHLDALSILRNDHEKVEKMFKSFHKTRTKDKQQEKAALVEEVCLELAIHAAVEEQLFYPMMAKAISADDLVGEAMVEHGEAKHLIGQLTAMDPGDPLYDATVLVLQEYVHHHVQEEQNKMFPKAQKAKLDLEALGESIMQRKGQLMSEVETKGIAYLLTPPQPVAGRKAH